MAHEFAKRLGWILTTVGSTIAVSSKWIVFPGLEMLLGIETIVGRDNVSYNPDGSYVFTNPGAMIAWIARVAAVGLCVAAAGIVLLAQSRKNRMPTRCFS